MKVEPIQSAITHRSSYFANFLETLVEFGAKNRSKFMVVVMMASCTNGSPVLASEQNAGMNHAANLTLTEWYDPTDSSHAAKAFGNGMRINGWTFFGSDQLANSFGDTSHRSENLPAYIAKIAVTPGALVARFAEYAAIPTPKNNGTHAGTLTLDSSQAQAELVTIRIGANAPAALKLAVLTDNLGAPEYAPSGISLAIDDKEPAVIANTPNGTPDWLIWDLPRLKEGAELSLRVQPSNGVATIGGLLFLSTSRDTANKPAEKAALPLIDRKIGEFSREGEYMKDYYVFKEGDTFHLFYNVGNAGESQQWFEAGNEKAFGHATSKDLKTWQHHPRVLNAVPGTWEGMVVSAPSIIKHEGTYYMFYTGFDDRVPGKQTIGLATSKDLFHWERHPGNPIYEVPPWAERRPDGWIDCRDSHVIKYGGEFLLFTMVTMANSGGKGAIALAASKNLIDWQDLGPAVETFKEPESPRVFQHGEDYYMFVSSAYGKQLLKTSNPKKGPWNPIPFRWPAPGLWSGWEVVEDGNRTIFSAFEWKSFGNHIRFWDVQWKDGLPSVIY